VAAPDVVGDFDLLGDDRLNLGAAGNAVNFVNSGQSVATLAGATAVADSILNGTVIYVTVNVETGLPGGSTDNTVVFWDTDADGDADEAIQLAFTPQVLINPADII
jgi:hypothetical protein